MYHTKIAEDAFNQHSKLEPQILYKQIKEEEEEETPADN